MEIYVILFWYEVVACMFLQKRMRKCDKAIEYSDGKLKIYGKQVFLLLLIILPLWLVMGMRDEIGRDYNEYKRIFEYISEEKRFTGVYTHIEIGLRLFDYLISLFTENPQWMFLWSSLVIVLGYVKGFYENKNSMLVCVTSFMGLGYYFYSMNIFRQYFAIAIVFFGIQYLERGNLKKFLAFVAVAALFHTSILIWIPALLLIKFLPGKNFYIITFMLAFLVYKNQEFLIDILSKYSRYQRFFEWESQFVQSRVSYTNLLITAMILIVSFLCRKQLLAIRKANDVRIKCMWMMFLTYIFLSFLGDSVVRLVLNFSFYGILILADAACCFDKKSRKFFQACYVVAMFLFVLVILNYDMRVTHQFVPYAFGTLEPGGY